MRLYLIRHGETPLNRQRIIQGHAEVPLSDLGIAQATRLGERLRAEPPDLIYASDLRRAAMTAVIIAAATGAPLTYDKGFRERDPGELTGESHEKAMRFFTDPDYRPPGGEGHEEFERRVHDAFEKLKRREGASERTIAVVSHGMVCGAFVSRQLGFGPEQRQEIRWHNTAISIFDFNGQWNVVTLADAAHLEGLDQDEGASPTGA